MVFSSLTFVLLFFPAVLLFYFISGSLRWKNGVLLVFSLLFYAWGEPIWVIAMIASTLINYFCAMAISSSGSSALRKLFLGIGVIVSVAMLFYFKYAAFLFNSFTGLLGSPIKLPVLELPIGISFYTFQILTYTVDVYRGKAPCMRNFPRLMLYISCFPQLIAGPIVQYADVCDALSNRETCPEGFIEGMRRFAVGLAKKVLIANVCALAMEQLPLDGVSDLSFAGAWYAALLYSMQIYFDFSGYSDMAIGMGRIFGFKYKENFVYPYISRSISEFWRRWHVSLGSFFRDYVYIPLGGNRKGALRTVINLLVVWSLTGFWHGADWNFLLWGAYYGVLIILERFVFKTLINRIPGIIRLIVTLILVVFGWVIFYYTDLNALGTHLLAMIGLRLNESGKLAFALFTDPVTIAVIRKYTLLPVLAAIACTPLIPAIKKLFVNKQGFYNLISNICFVAELALSLLFIIGQSYNPFIYFRF